MGATRYPFRPHKIAPSASGAARTRPWRSRPAPSPSQTKQRTAEIAAARRNISPPAAATAGSAVLGVGMAVMHYTGMRALHLPAQIVWAPELIAAATVFAVVFAIASLNVAVRSRGLSSNFCGALQLARMMGGDVTATSEAGRGSTFTFSFHAAAASQREEDIETGAVPAVPQLPDRNQLRHARILLTDDNAINRQVIRLLLAPLGVSITEAENGRQALDKLAAERFDLVLLDVHMPVMDGRQTIEAIRRSAEAWRTIPVIALTADAMSGDREKYLALGMDDYLSKPVDQRELHAKLMAMLVTQPSAAATG